MAVLVSSFARFGSISTLSVYNTLIVAFIVFNDATATGPTTVSTPIYETPNSFYTNTTSYQVVWTGINMTGRSSLVFRVKAAMAAIVLLATIPGNDATELYFVVFDSALKATGIGRNSTFMLTSINVYGVLNGGLAPVWLWVTWSDGLITCGSGKIVGQNSYLILQDPTPYKNISTVAVSTRFNVGDWAVPYDQSADKIPNPLQDIEDTVNDTVYDKVLCDPEVTISFPTTTPSRQSILVSLNGRTSISYRVESYKSIATMNFTTDTDIYTIQGSTVAVINKNGNKLTGTTLPSSFLTTPMAYWVSWNNGIFVLGAGSTIGQQAIAIVNESIPIRITGMVANMTGTIIFQFPYFVSVKALVHPESDGVLQDTKFRRFASDMCLNFCSSDVLDNPNCRWSTCSGICLRKPKCTAFCLRPPPSPGSRCLCELYAIPGDPSLDLFRNETGAAYYQIVN